VARSRWFWIALTVLGVGGAVAAVRLFSVALPNISLTITMDRGEALDQAGDLAVENGWGSPDDRAAASFGPVDSEVQTYVELEGGGRDVFTDLGARGLWEPYQWTVRRFAERRVEEAVVSFTPTGDPYGFRLRLSEDDPGAGNLEPDAARALVETAGLAWGIEWSAFRLIESTQEAMPGGRRDHELVFERTDETVGDARFRLRAHVAGDRVSELTRFVWVPEAFSRRYADMRATNDMIALVSQAVFMLVFVLLGAGVGSALLLRSRWLEWRAPLAWGAVIAFLFGLNTLNQMPLAWMSYDTALSATSFVLQQLGGSFAIGLLGTPLVAFFLLAGESLGRRAFAGHLQQWRLWTRDVASSNTALGLTVAAYLMVGLQLGYVVLFYLGTQRLEGWWSPADALVQPDLLATYVPWLQAVSIALFASFWEESVFRAVPIACAALLGARFGRRGLWVWGAVVVQALVFAAAHANYPQQPPYARVVELTAPALLWGVVYVRFGLVPTILAHFLYDLSLFSLVLFESEALVDQGVIIAVALTPLALVLAARARFGARARPPSEAMNAAWSPPAPAVAASVAVPAERAAAGPAAALEATGASPAPARRSPLRLPSWAVAAAGGVGGLLWLGAQLTAPPPPRLDGDASRARAAAVEELRARGVPVERWRVHPLVTSGPTDAREYVYREAGPEAYAQMSGTYFDTPRWVIRFVDWRADPEARVEEYRVWVGEGSRVTRVWHALPEARAGAALDVATARSLATEAAVSRLDLDASRLREVEAEETSRPERTDWRFTFSELGLLEGVAAEARVEVRVAGDEVTDVSRSIRLPEEWLRSRRELASRRTIMRGGLLVLLVVGFIAAGVTAVVSWSRGRLVGGVATRIGLPVLLALTLSALNGLPETFASFTTAQPWGLQVGALAIALFLAGLVAASAIGLVSALAVTWLVAGGGDRGSRTAPVAWGLLAAGAWGAVRVLLPSAPPVPTYAGAANFVPWLAAPLGVVMPYSLVTASLLMALAARERFRSNPFVGSAVLTVLAVSAVVLMPESVQASLPLWGVGALIASVLLLVSLRVLAADPVLVPGIVGTVFALSALDGVWHATHAGARLGGILAVLVSAGLAWASTRMLAAPTRPAGQSVEESRASVGNV